MNAEFSGLLIDDFRADDVRRQHVHGELNTAEVQVDSLGDGINKQRLREARHTLQEQVAAGEHCDHDALDDDVLTDDDLADARAHVADELLGSLHGRRIRMGWHKDKREVEKERFSEEYRSTSWRRIAVRFPT